MKNDSLSPILRESEAMIDKACHRSVNPDIKKRQISCAGVSMTLYYIEGLVSGSKIELHMLTPLMKLKELPKESRAELLAKSVLSVSECEVTESLAAVLDAVFYGGAALIIDGDSYAAVADAKNFAKRGIGKPVAEQVVIGPHEAFNEALRDNLTILRRILRTENFISESAEVGTRIKTQAAILYLSGIADEKAITETRRRISGIALDHVEGIGVLMQLIEDEPNALLPQFVITERPDRIVSFMLEGQICILLDGSAQALCLPSNLFTFLHAPDDSYIRWQYGTFNRIVRFVGVCVSILLPAISVSAIRYQPGLLPPPLLTSVMEAQSKAPLPVGEEIAAMLLFFYLINEAGMRVPGIMGSSLGLVSSLVLGSAAVDAELVSPLLIIIVAVSGLGLYAAPNYGLGMGLRLWQFILLIFASCFGLTGLAIGGSLALMSACALRSLGAPYLAPLLPKRPRNPDLMLRLPVWRQRLRGITASPYSLRRSSGRMRAWEEDDDED